MRQATKNGSAFFIRIAFYATVFCEAVHFCAAASIVVATRLCSGIFLVRHTFSAAAFF